MHTQTHTQQPPTCTHTHTCTHAHTHKKVIIYFFLYLKQRQKHNSNKHDRDTVYLFLSNFIISERLFLAYAHGRVVEVTGRKRITSDLTAMNAPHVLTILATDPLSRASKDCQILQMDSECCQIMFLTFSISVNDI